MNHFGQNFLRWQTLTPSQRSAITAILVFAGLLVTFILVRLVLKTGAAGLLVAVIAGVYAINRVNAKVFGTPQAPAPRRWYQFWKMD